jgi:hypothetical protein
MPTGRDDNDEAVMYGCPFGAGLEELFGPAVDQCWNYLLLGNGGRCLRPLVSTILFRSIDAILQVQLEMFDIDHSGIHGSRRRCDR